MASMCSSLDRINMDISNLLPDDGPQGTARNLDHHVVLTWKSANPIKRGKWGVRTACRVGADFFRHLNSGILTATR